MNQWIDLKGYEGFYLINNKGEIKRNPQNLKGVNNKYKNDYLLKPKDNGKGYLRVKLTIKNKSKRVMIHRLIADSFIPNPQNYKTVHHIDNNKKNNSIDNLMWCTQSYNCKIEYDLGRRKITEKQIESAKRNLSLVRNKEKITHYKNKIKEYEKNQSNLNI